MKKKSKIIVFIIGMVFALSISFNLNFNINTQKNAINFEHQDIIDLKSPKSSGVYSEHFIYIDGNWSVTTTYDWCYGKGTWEEPYIIENVNIDAGSSPTGSGIFINNSKNDYFTIRNCTVYNAGSEEYDAGIKLENTNNGTLTNNNCSNNGKNGILMFGLCENNTISGNIVSNLGTNNQDHGIRLEGGLFDWVPTDVIDIGPNNDSSPLTWGTYGTGATHASRIYNRAWDNRGLLGTSSHQIDTFYMEDIDINETEERIYEIVVRLYGQDLWADCQLGINGSHESINAPQWQSFPGFMAWRYFTFSGLQLTEDDINDLEISIIGIGSGLYTFVEVMYIDCYIERLDFIGPQGNIISENIASKNTYSGIKLALDCDNNIISGNFLFENGYGIYLDNESNDNSIFYNSISDNSIKNAYDNGTNYWDNSFLGNFWGDYLGVDVNNDGIGDTPYNVTGAGGNEDYKPLMNIKPFFCATPDDVVYEVGTSGNNLIWKAIDISRFLLTCDILMNGLNIESGLLVSQIADIEINIDGLTPDNYIFTIELYDGGGTRSSDSVLVTVTNSAPVFTTTPDDLTYVVGQTGNNLSWTFSDVSTDNPTYTIYRNSMPIVMNEPCLSDELIEISVDGLNAGIYNFIIEINDGYGGTVIDSVFLSVTSEYIPPAVPPAVPGYDLFILIGTICIVSIVLIKKRWK